MRLSLQRQQQYSEWNTCIYDSPGASVHWPTAQHLRLRRAAYEVQVRPLRASD
jgi:hypothetical protein